MTHTGCYLLVQNVLDRQATFGCVAKKCQFFSNASETAAPKRSGGRLVVLGTNTSVLPNLYRAEICKGNRSGQDQSTCIQQLEYPAS